MNPISYGNIEYTYEGRKLKTIYIPDGNSYERITYEYDDEGLLVSRNYLYVPDDDTDEINETTYYYYEDGNLVTEITPNVRNDYLYDKNGNLYGFIQNNTNRYYYIKDILNNIIGIVDSSGILITRYYIDAYGYRVLKEGNTTIYNPFIYKGYYYDTYSNMYYCKTRFYNPYFRRWLNYDNVDYLDIKNVGCINLYAYCNNNPVMFVDYDGDYAPNGLIG